MKHQECVFTLKPQHATCDHQGFDLGLCFDCVPWASAADRFYKSMNQIGQGVQRREQKKLVGGRGSGGGRSREERVWLYLNEFVGDEVTNDATGVNDLLSFIVALC